MSLFLAKLLNKNVGIFAVTGIVVMLTIGVGVHGATAQTYAIPEVAGRLAQSVQTPTNVHIVDRKSRAISLAWFSDIRTMTGGFGVAAIPQTVYTVSVYSQKGVFIRSVQTSQTSVTIKGLDRGRLYTFVVTAARGGFTSGAAEVKGKTLKGM